jgi:hypothetical protein
MLRTIFLLSLVGFAAYLVVPLSREQISIQLTVAGFYVSRQKNAIILLRGIKP